MYYFNPENDMALADGRPYYKAPAEIERMRRDLCLLPMWYAEEGSWVKIDSMHHPLQMEDCPILPHMYFSVQWKQQPVCPWGWSPSLVYQLRQNDVESGCYPSDGQIERIRQLSGRQQCAVLQRRLRETVNEVRGESVVCESMEEVKRWVQLYGETLLKSPWSGSGRGLVRVSPFGWTQGIEGWAARILRVQGALMAEPIYNKVYDFAMEFYASVEGSVAFCGYSLFETDTHGNYKMNRLLSDAAIEKLLGEHVPCQLLLDVREALEHELALLIAGAYTGYLGVDMMVCREGNEYWLHPCVEVNLRMNMGVVARIVYDRYLLPEVQGTFVVEHYAADDEALAFHRRMADEHPAEYEQGKLRKGYLSLTPVQKVTHYQAYVLVGG